jgi:hypothetical protein
VSRQSRSSSISSQARSAHTRPSFDHTIRRRVPDKDNVEDRAGRVRLPTHINILWKRCTDKDIAPTSLPWCVMIYLPLMSCERSIVCITRRETPDTPHSPHRPNSRSRRVPRNPTHGRGAGSDPPPHPHTDHQRLETSPGAGPRLAPGIMRYPIG